MSKKRRTQSEEGSLPPRIDPQEREPAEETREVAEEVRQTAEYERLESESGRAAAETARLGWSEPAELRKPLGQRRKGNESPRRSSAGRPRSSGRGQRTCGG
jgi:hypothetical protein